jgi:hypothetical protein
VWPQRAATAASQLSFGRKVLFSLMVFGGVGSTIGAGTFASYNATTENASSSFQTGTLVLGNQKDTGRICLSTGGSDLTGSTYDTVPEPNTISGGTPGSTSTDTNTASCDTVVDNVTLREPGDSVSVNMTISNVGSLAGSLALVVPCTSTASPDQAYFNGTTNLCSVLEVSLQEYASIPKRTALDTAGGYCWFGQTTGYNTACATTGALLSTLASGLTLQHAGQAPYQQTLAGGVRVFTLTLRLPTTAASDQQLQGRLADFDLSWTLT